MTVFDWLEGVPIPEGQRAFDIVEVRFKRNRKGFFRIGQGRRVQTGDVAVVDAVPGEDMGIVSLTGELVRAQMKAKARQRHPRNPKGGPQGGHERHHSLAGCPQPRG